MVKKTGPETPAPDRQPPADALTRGRLTVALDALLSRRNVTQAAQDLGVQTSAMSRLLAQLREELGDPLFVRSGRGLVPTPFAEALRPRVRAVAASLDALFTTALPSIPGDSPLDPQWNVPTDIPAPPLAVRPAHLLDGEPSAQDLIRKLDRTPADAPPHRRLARHIGVLGIAGGGNGRPLTEDEAEEALSIILSGEADPVQIGALFGMMRLRGSTAPELAGFVRAARSHIAARVGTGLSADLDWPCYTSPNYHNPPWFFHAARLLARAGLKVVLHGSTGTGQTSGRYQLIARSLDIPVCTTAQEIGQALIETNIAYIPLASLAPQIYRLLGLHGLMEVRSPVFETVHMLKPVDSRTSLLGVAKPTYKDLHRDTARLLGWQNLSVLGGTRDVAQFSPFRLSTIHRLTDGLADDVVIPAQMHQPPPTPRPRGTNLEYWHSVWTGGIRDTRAELTVIGTAAFALLSLPGTPLDSFSQAMDLATRLWRDRHAPTAESLSFLQNGQRAGLINRKG
ncbi:glycosyl transferase family protein [Novispirillum itersonii]|uniref:glycosyl transferase family protein n=1 Tax=Novispirillum itersonii TaxID=189 RepID=UPI0003602770|nr:glycosyl transferase family protein [Novispirillum itersonii]